MLSDIIETPIFSNHCNVLYAPYAKSSNRSRYLLSLLFLFYCLNASKKRTIKGTLNNDQNNDSKDALHVVSVDSAGVVNIEKGLHMKYARIVLVMV